MMLLFGNEIFSTLMKSAGRISSKIERTSSFSFSQHVEELHGWRRNIRETKNLAPIRDMVIHLCKTICDLVQQQRQHPKNILSSSFLSFLAEHKNNPELCLTMMADHFNLTEAYISHMFREQTGEKFSSCLEKIRISEATELLKRDYLIDEIVTMTGYQYKNTFYKAFKRVMHVSPGQYRENILQNARKSDR